MPAKWGRRYEADALKSLDCVNGRDLRILEFPESERHGVFRVS